MAIVNPLPSTPTNPKTGDYHDPTDEELAERKPDEYRKEIVELFNK